MRVVGGELRGRQLKSPVGRKVRPTSDRIREAIYDMLGPDLEGTKVLDLFAGTGAMGIEALSRGFQTGVFVENDRGALNLIRDNLDLCGLADRARVEARDVFEFLKRFDAAAPFDLVLVDPPYGEGMVLPAVEQLACKTGLRAGGYVVCECERELELPDEVKSLKRIKYKSYGDSSVHVYKCTREESAG
jgi:16S rRNA (guanine(966)-N(2))-methyltransferase RsmD